jgi:hypothetical protein
MKWPARVSAYEHGTDWTAAGEGVETSKQALVLRFWRPKWPTGLPRAARLREGSKHQNKILFSHLSEARTRNLNSDFFSAWM